jgi:hypothetical protein
MSSLRHIAVHVEEPRTGEFAWVLTERAGDIDDRWQPLERAKSTVGSYKAAMAEGLLALQRLVDDLEVGPRSEDKKEVQPAPRSAKSKPAPTTAKASFFGFGPAR